MELTIVLLMNCLSVVIEVVFRELTVATSARTVSVTMEAAIRELNEPSCATKYPVCKLLPKSFCTFTELIDANSVVRRIEDIVSARIVLVAMLEIFAVLNVASRAENELTDKELISAEASFRAVSI